MVNGMVRRKRGREWWGRTGVASLPKTPPMEVTSERWKHLGVVSFFRWLIWIEIKEWTRLVLGILSQMVVVCSSEGWGSCCNHRILLILGNEVHFFKRCSPLKNKQKHNKKPSKLRIILNCCKKTQSANLLWNYCKNTGNEKKIRTLILNNIIPA